MHELRFCVLHITSFRPVNPVSDEFELLFSIFLRRLIALEGHRLSSSHLES